MNTLVKYCLSVLILSTGIAAPTMAEERTTVTADKGTILVYRGKEKRSRNVSFVLYVNEASHGRLNSNEFQMIEVPAGVHTVWSSLSKKAVNIDVNAGERVYVSTNMKKTGGKYKAKFGEVNEELALVEFPALQEALQSQPLLSMSQR